MDSTGCACTGPGRSPRPMGSNARRSELKALILTREYPPDIYGGAGVHVSYLVRELARLIPVEVRTFGEQAVEAGNLVVQGYGAAAAGAAGAPERFRMALQALSVGIGVNARPIDAQVVH